MLKKTDKHSNTISNTKDILNAAMNISLEWGENWLKPINERLLAVYPNVSEEKAKEIDTYIRVAREDIFKVIEQYYLKELSEIQAISIIQEKYTFLDDDTLKRLFNQGMYYAWRDNG